MIKNSFKITGIYIKLDGTENYQVKKNDEISEEKIIPEDFLEDIKDFRNIKVDDKKTK